jgi:hypothetical protein
MHDPANYRSYAERCHRLAHFMSKGHRNALFGTVVLTACFTASALAQTPQGDQSNRRLALQQKSEQYVPPPPSPAERMRCKVQRPGLNAASRRACRAIKGQT